MLINEVIFEAGVYCSTFNHARYIEDAFRGFCMQYTDFPYICFVFDDYSTDGEQEVIRQYLSVNFLHETIREDTDDYEAVLCRHKSNENCYFAVFFLKYNHYSKGKSAMSYIRQMIDNIKYFAFCEGDDFWIAADFLQSSVDYLNLHDDYSAVFGNKLVSNEKGELVKRIRFRGGLNIHDIMRGRNMGIRNLCFRKDCLFVHPFETSFRDIHVYYKCAVSGKLKFIDRDFAIYRLTGEGVHSSLQEKELIYTSILHYYDFHRRVGFKYQKDCVNYQIRKLIDYIASPSLFVYCCKLLRQYHMPSRRRYLWYIQYGFLTAAAHFKGLFGTN